MKYLHYFEVNIGHLYMKVGYGCVTETEIMEPGYHNVFMITEDEARSVARKNGYRFMNGKIKHQKAATEEKVQKAASGKRMPSAKCLDDARRIQGKGKYRSMMNFCYGDGYFARSCIDKYGEAMWKEANEIVRNEK